MKKLLFVFTATLLAVLACSSPEPGESGERGHSCTVKAYDDGSKKISCEDGSEVLVFDGERGEPGEAGEPGPKGDTGAQGNTGDAGVSCSIVTSTEGKVLSCSDGSSVALPDVDNTPKGACDGNTPPVFSELRLKLDSRLPVYQGSPRELLLTASDADGDELQVLFSGSGARFEQGASSLEWTMVPQTEGGPFTYSASVSDGCQVVARTFTVKRVLTPGLRAFAVSGDESSTTVFDVLISEDYAWEIGELNFGGVEAIAVNPVSNKLYLHSNRSEGGALYELNPANAEAVQVSETDLQLSGMSFSPEGVLYGIDKDRGLLRIDLERGDAELIDPRLMLGSSLAFRGSELWASDEYILNQVSPSTGEFLQVIFPDDLGSPLGISLSYDPHQDRFLLMYRNGSYSSFVTLNPNTGERSYPWDVAYTPGQSTVFTAFTLDTLAHDRDLAPPSDFEVVMGQSSALLKWKVRPGAAQVDGFYIGWEAQTPSAGSASGFALLDRDMSEAFELDSPPIQEGDDFYFPLSWTVLGLKADTEYVFSVYSKDFQGNISNPASETATPLGAAPVDPRTLYAISSEELFVIDLEQNQIEKLGDLVRDDPYTSFNSIAIAPNGEAYLISQHYPNSKLHHLDLETFEVSFMTEIPTLVRNLRISSNGEFLVIDTQDVLSELDPDTGALTPLDSDVSAEGGFAWQGESLVFFDLYYHTLLKWNEQGEDEWLGDVTGQVDYYSSTIPSLTFGLSLEGYFLADWYGETRDYTHLFTIDPNTLAQEIRLVAKELYLYDLAFGPLPTP